jgi:hypothetical protein
MNDTPLENGAPVNHTRGTKRLAPAGRLHMTLVIIASRLEEE